MRDEFRIVSLVSSTKVGMRLNLRHLALSDLFRYEPELMSSAIFEHPKHRGKAMVYASGAVLIAGQRSVEEAGAMQASLYAALAELGVPDPGAMAVLTVRNIVAVGAFGVPIDLREACVKASARGYETDYDPSGFAGLRMRVKGQRLLVTLFRSGKYTLTGARTPSDVEAGRHIAFSIAHDTVGDPSDA